MQLCTNPGKEDIGKSNFSHTNEHWILLKFPMRFHFLQVLMIAYSLTIKPRSTICSHARHPMPMVLSSTNISSIVSWL